MALKVYQYRGGTYQFEDGDVPEGAVLVKAVRAPTNKAVKSPTNKTKGGRK